jgi:hypothetical protein
LHRCTSAAGYWSSVSIVKSLYKEKQGPIGKGMRAVGVAWGHAWPLTVLKPAAEIRFREMAGSSFVMANMLIWTSINE